MKSARFGNTWGGGSECAVPVIRRVQPAMVRTAVVPASKSEAAERKVENRRRFSILLVESGLFPKGLSRITFLLRTMYPINVGR